MRWALLLALVGCDDGDPVPVELVDGGVDGGLVDCGPAAPPFRHDCEDARRGALGECVLSADLCAADEVPALEGGCMRVGADCGERGPDGRCVAPPAPPGMRPTLAGPPAAVGPAQCAPEFVVDGVCRVPADACAVGTFPVPSRGCVDLAGLCDDPWPEGGVHIGGLTVPPNGDGSAERPLRYLDEAYDRGLAGPFLLGPGRHVLPDMTRDAEIIGVCPDQTVVVPFEGRPAPDKFGIYVRGGETRISRVSVESPDYCAFVPAGRLIIEDSRLVTCGMGLGAGRNGSAEIHGSLVANADRDAGEIFGAGVTAESGAPVTIVGSALLGNEAVQVRANGAPVEIIDSVLADAPDVGTVWVGDRGSVTLTDSVVARASRQAALVRGGTLRLVRSAVVDTAPFGDPNVDPPFALDAVDGTIEVTDSVLMANANGDIRGLGARTEITVTRSLSAHSVAIGLDGDSGFGVVSLGGALSIEDSAFVAHPTLGIVADRDDEREVAPEVVSVSGVFVGNGRESWHQASGGVLLRRVGAAVVTDSIFVNNGYHALIIADALETTLQRLSVAPTADLPWDAVPVTLANTRLVESHSLAIENPLGAGLLLAAPEGAITAVRVDAGRCADGAQVGAVVQSGGALELEAAHFSDGCGTGVLVAEQDARLECRGCLLEGVGRMDEFEFAVGAAAARGARLRLVASTVRDVAGIGAVALGAGSLLRLEGSTVRDIDTVAADEYGYGVAINPNARGELVDVLIDRPHVVGVVGLGGAVQAERLMVTEPGAGVYVAESGDRVEGGGDGVHVVGGQATLTDVAVSSPSRFGLLMSSVTGSVSGGWVRGAGETAYQSGGDPVPTDEGLDLCGNEDRRGEGSSPRTPAERFSPIPDFTDPD